jgi:hypothetical protein
MFRIGFAFSGIFLGSLFWERCCIPLKKFSENMPARRTTLRRAHLYWWNCSLPRNVQTVPPLTPY